MKKPELLSPAGNLEKLKFAIDYGADAVYLALDRFGMRAAAGNFTAKDMEEGLRYAHGKGKKAYLALNTMPNNGEIDFLPEFLRQISHTPPDAFIVADMGVFAVCKKILPAVELHISTQGANMNYLSCRMWHDMGASRIVLSRELSLEEIAEIRAKTPDTLALEAFVHGAMCVSVSGRCLLSEYYVDRDANRGMCAQPCRWIYRFSEEKRPNDLLTGEVHPEGTYLFGSKDMKLIEHIPSLAKAGIDSFKIEGRMKSAYYAAVITNAYRTAIDSYFDAPEKYQFDERLNAELDSVSHREYCTGYYFDHPMLNPHLASEPGYIREKAFLATVNEYDGNTGLALCFQKNKMNSGDTLQLLSPGKTGVDFVCGKLYDTDMNEISSTPHPQMLFYLKMPFDVKPGDIIRA